jgi:DNA-binding transcriptional regulator LsrR (DeoR family)
MLETCRMKRVDTITRIRRAHYVQKWPVKKIVRELHVSRNTVPRFLRSPEPHAGSILS